MARTDVMWALTRVFVVATAILAAYLVVSATLARGAR